MLNPLFTLGVNCPAWMVAKRSSHAWLLLEGPLDNLAHHPVVVVALARVESGDVVHDVWVSGTGAAQGPHAVLPRITGLAHRQVTMQ